jgi:hypothetical protein
LKDAIAKRRQGGPEKAAAPAQPAGPAANVSGQPPAGGATDLTLIGPGGPGPVRPNGGLAENFDQERRLITQQVQTEVQVAVNHARTQMSTEPEGAIENLKLTLQKVQQVQELSPDVRSQLAGIVERALDLAERQKVVVEQRRQEQAERIAGASERRLIADNFLRNQERNHQRMERFESLMDEADKAESIDKAQAKYDSAKGVAGEAERLDPTSPVFVLAVDWARSR